MKRSTGLRNHMLSVGSLKSALDGTVIKFFSGAEPPTADDALGGATLLCTITRDGDGVTGLTLAPDAAGGQITKNTSEVWEGEIIANGQATFFRQESLADSGLFSESAIRLQGSVGMIDADIELSDVAFIIGDTRRLRFYVAAIPAG